MLHIWIPAFNYVLSHAPPVSPLPCNSSPLSAQCNPLKLDKDMCFLCTLDDMFAVLNFCVVLTYASHLVSAKYCPFPCFLLSTHILQSKIRLSVPFPYLYYDFQTGPLFFSLLLHVAAKSILKHNSDLVHNLSVTLLFNEKSLGFLGGNAQGQDIWFQPVFRISPPLFHLCWHLHTWKHLILLYFLRVSFSFLYLPQSWKQGAAPFLHSHPSRPRLRCHKICSNQVWINNIPFGISYFIAVNIWTLRTFGFRSTYRFLHPPIL